MPETLLENNRLWARQIRKLNPDFFQKLSEQQTPNFLWIGCSDSRVPANELVGMLPGEMFVHRNVANLVVHTDLNCLSVMQYAIDVLKVKHIIVCGHYGCGGVLAALDDKPHGLIDNWLRHIQDVIEKYETELQSITDKRQQFDRLCELNVREQVINVCQTTVVRTAWQRQQSLSVHGWIYGLSDGLLRNLDITIDSPQKLAEISGHSLLHEKKNSDSQTQPH